jgi:hypothetical protein
MSAQLMAKELCRGEHRRADPDNEDQMDEINVMFGGSMSIASKTQEKKIEREIMMRTSLLCIRLRLLQL